MSKQEIMMEQLGGHKMRVMTGATGFMTEGDNILRFSFKGNVKTGNKCRLILEADDTYTMEFYAWNRRSLDCKKVAAFDGLFNWDLKRVFTQQTGLYVTL